MPLTTPKPKLQVGDTYESTAVDGHLRVYTVIGYHRDGSPRAYGFNAHHSENCLCTTDPESWY